MPIQRWTAKRSQYLPYRPLLVKVRQPQRPLMNCVARDLSLAAQHTAGQAQPCYNPWAMERRQPCLDQRAGIRMLFRMLLLPVVVKVIACAHHPGHPRMQGTLHPRTQYESHLQLHRQAGAVDQRQWAPQIPILQSKAHHLRPSSAAHQARSQTVSRATVEALLLAAGIVGGVTLMMQTLNGWNVLRTGRVTH